MKARIFLTLLTLASALALTQSFAETITFSADSMNGVSGKNSDKTTLSGHAKIKADAMEISADSIELYGKDFRFMKATGSIKGTNSQSKLDFTCTSMTYDRVTKIAVLRNTVHLVDKENNVTADAELIEYNQNTEIAVMQLNVYIVQDENTCSAAHAIYNKKQQLLDMSGNPQIVQNKDTFRAQEISLNLKTNEITLDGRVHGSVTTKDSASTSSSSASSKEGTSSTKEGSASKDKAKDESPSPKEPKADLRATKDSTTSPKESPDKGKEEQDAKK